MHFNHVLKKTNKNKPKQINKVYLEPFRTSRSFVPANKTSGITVLNEECVLGLLHAFLH